MYRRPLVLIVILLALALVGSAAALGESQPAANTYTGTLTVIVGDPMPIAGEPMTPIPPIFTLNLAGGGELRLLPGAAGENELLRLAGQQVSVTLPAAEAEAALAAADPAAPGVPVASVALAPGAVMVSPEVSGNTKWVTIACQFPDRPAVDPTYTAGYFQQMYRNSRSGLDHYWREVSYDHINLTGSTALGWFTLPNPYADYFGLGTISLSQVTLDCMTAADPFVFFPDYYGVQIVLGNDDLNFAQGGTIEEIFDGERILFGMTWMPRWTLGMISVFEHEMGHGYGLDYHTYSGLQPYGDPWDVMSYDRYNCANFRDPIYGCYGQHTIGRNKKYLGWIPSERVYVAGSGSHTLTLERTALPGPSGYLMAEIPIDGSATHYYLVEARQTVGYDDKLPGQAVIIHEIAENSGYLRQFELVSPGGVGNPNQGVGDGANVMWLPGETFAAPRGGITVHIDAATATGFTVTINSGWASQTAVLSPTDDTYIRRIAPNANYGGDTVLKVEPIGNNGTVDIRSAIKFNRLEIPSNAYRLRLRLAVVADGGDEIPCTVVTLSPYYLNTTTPWTEFGLTWNNEGGGLDAMWPTSIRAGSWLEHDLTYGYGWYGTDVASLALIKQSGSNLVQFSSKEGFSPPQLVVDYLVPRDEPTTHTFTPTNDATVNQAKPKLISGGKPTLQVKDAAKDLNAYVKFNVTGLEGAVRSATLRLWVTNGGPDGGRVYATSPFYPGTTTQWLETGLKWSNAPAIAGTPLAAAGAVTAKHWIELDVTGAVMGNGRASFALTNDAADLVVYSSKEGAHAPELVIVTD